MKGAIGMEDHGDQRILEDIKSQEYLVTLESVESKDVVLVGWEPWNRN